MDRIVYSIEVNAPVEDCYALWSHFEHLPRFMENVDSVEKTSEPDVWRWRVKGLFGRTVEWDAHVDMMQPNQLISWHSLHHSSVDTSGRVQFHPLGETKTQIEVDMAYEPTTSEVGEFVATLFQNPSRMVARDLHNFKKIAEQCYLHRMAYQI